MGKEIISTSDAPRMPFSSAVRAGDYLFLSGHGGFSDALGNNVEGIEAQTRQCLENIKRTLAAAGASLSDVVKVTVFLGAVGDFGKMNEVYRRYFAEEPPARSTAVTGLVVPGMLIEMECVAYAPPAK